MESLKHFKGKASIEKILLEDGWTIGIRDGDDKFPFLTSLGLREYYPDLMAWKDGIGWVVFEVDGKKGHTTLNDVQKMKMRDNAFATVGIKTVRIKTDDLVGKRKQPVAIILKEIEWQLVHAKTTCTSGESIELIS